MGFRFLASFFFGEKGKRNEWNERVGHAIMTLLGAHYHVPFWKSIFDIIFFSYSD